MANPVVKTYTSGVVTPGPQEAISLDYVPMGVAFFGVYIVSGTATFGVQFTLDDVTDASITPTWFDLEEIPTGTTATSYASVPFPVRFVRLNLAAVSASVTFTIAQSVTPRA